MNGKIDVLLNGPIAHLTIGNRPRRNALTVAMWAELKNAFDAFANNETLRCVVIRGDGDSFCAGADMSEFERVRSTRAQVEHFHETCVLGALTAISESPVPVVAAIGGVCMGGGLEIAAVCDIRIACASASFGAAVGRLGFPLAFAETQAVFRVAGAAVLAEMLLEGRMLTAQEALAKGLVARVVDDEHLAAEAEATAARICESSPLAAHEHKRQIRRLLRDATPVTREERIAVYAFAETEDYRIGYRAFLEKKKPRFVGR